MSQALEISNKESEKQSSYIRRWNDAISVMQYSISTKTQLDSDFDIKSFSFDQSACDGGNYLNENPLQLALTQNRYEPMLKLMDSFWKQLTDIKLLPLTSNYYPDPRTLSKKKFT